MSPIDQAFLSGVGMGLGIGLLILLGYVQYQDWLEAKSKTHELLE